MSRASFFGEDLLLLEVVLERMSLSETDAATRPPPPGALLPSAAKSTLDALEMEREAILEVVASWNAETAARR